MEKYAVIQFGPKQYKVSEGTTFKVDQHQATLDCKVLAYFNGSSTVVGEPYLENISVGLSLVQEKRDRKIMVKRFKSKSRYHKTKGHRQDISYIKVNSLSDGIKEEKKVEKVAKKETPKVEATTEVKTEKKIVKKQAKKEVKKVKEVKK